MATFIFVLQLSSIYIWTKTQEKPQFIERQTNIPDHQVTDLDWKCTCVEPPQHHAPWNSFPVLRVFASACRVLSSTLYLLNIIPLLLSPHSEAIVTNHKLLPIFFLKRKQDEKDKDKTELLRKSPKVAGCIFTSLALFTVETVVDKSRLWLSRIQRETDKYNKYIILSSFQTQSKVS